MRGSFLDTFDLARRSWVHGSFAQSSSVGHPRPAFPGALSGETQVWTGSEVLIWGGYQQRTANGFSVVTYPQTVTHYAPAKCTP